MLQGDLDDGLDIPQSDKSFAGLKKDEKHLDVEVHHKRSLRSANHTSASTSGEGSGLMTWKRHT